MTGNIFIVKLSFFGRESICKYFMGKQVLYTVLFSYVVESIPIKTPTNSIDQDLDDLKIRFFVVAFDTNYKRHILWRKGIGSN